jgi:uncharacterized protein
MPRCGRATANDKRGDAVTTDKTGATTTVSAEDGRFTIGVDGHTVGLAEYADRDGQRIFTHTEVEPDYEGRGLATILVSEALEQTRDAGLRIVPVCQLVANFVDKHDEYADVVDPVDRDVKRWLSAH